MMDSTQLIPGPYSEAHKSGSPSIYQITDMEEMHPVPDHLLPEERHHRRRSSAFFETGLGGQDAIFDAKIRRTLRPKLRVRFKTDVEVVESQAIEWPDETDSLSSRWLATQSPPKPPVFFPTLPRILVLGCLIALLLQSLNETPLLKASVVPIGAAAVPVRQSKNREVKDISSDIVRRQTSETVTCFRWSQQTAIVNGTLYSYGGRASTQTGQTEDTWNNDFLTYDLTKSWQISSPTVEGLAQPAGPPPVANGYLWNSYDALYLYGGEFSDHPVTSPLPFSTWSYDIPSSSWQEYSSPAVAAGTNSDDTGAAVQRAAEGAGVTVANLGRGFYFGGHLDGYTTQGWSQSIARVYLTSLLEYTFPGYANTALSGDQVAGPDGTYRNVTEGGSQSTAGFPERADGVLVFVPGFGKEGIIIGLAGGTNATFTQLNIIDIYDIAESTWHKQYTTGPTPEYRVNPCAVAVAAADGSSIQVYMYGGQNLIPYGSQVQYDDVWVLTIPSFTWIQVDTSDQSVPAGRAGHTCNVWNSQMVVVGGYTGAQTLSCDSPGVYVFNTSALTWQFDYNVLGSDDAFNRQKSQQSDPNALQGSYGYEVPAAVQKVVGGSAAGGATVTGPAQTPISGPLATGKPNTYTLTTSVVTATSNSAVVTKTSVSTSVSTNAPTSGTGGNDAGTSSGKGGSSSNVAAIAAGVVAGFFALLAAYLGFCAWVYRRQLELYKNHVAMQQRAQLAGDTRYIGPLGGIGGKYNDKTPSSSNGANRRSSNESRSGRSGNSAPNGAANGLLASNNPYRTGPGAATPTAASSTEDLMAGHEPSFLGVVLNPRRSLRVVNRD